eukprot:TRINITY_DN5451_c0_g1_i1.p1 TRINITY_DN5451_c0_g1~~TRINITY_DN5451_c0_g1_i1.p1  ORF type:complete len:332 (+),score=44.40 TRINITY_DN5451_c0_g1_i1:98-997(+)
MGKQMNSEVQNRSSCFSFEKSNEGSAFLALQRHRNLGSLESKQMMISKPVDEEYSKAKRAKTFVLCNVPTSSVQHGEHIMNEESTSLKNSAASTCEATTPFEKRASSFILQDPQPRGSQIVLENGIVLNPLPRIGNAKGFQKFSKENQHSLSGDGNLSCERGEDLTKRVRSFTVESPYLTPFSPAMMLHSASLEIGSQLLGLVTPMLHSRGNTQPQPLRLDPSLLLGLATPKEVCLGAYTREERNEKISRYKSKICKWREQHPVNRSFKGRSRVAETKPRVKGRFVKKSEQTDEEKKEK